jgi:hypothetical protein
MAIDVKEYSKLTGLNETAAAESIARGDEFAAWRIPGGAAYIESKDAMEDVLEADTSNDTVVTVVVDDEPTGDAGAGEGTDEGDGADLDDLDGEDDGETVEE